MFRENIRAIPSTVEQSQEERQKDLSTQFIYAMVLAVKRVETAVFIYRSKYIFYT